jgi:hypothetical protein
MRQERTIQAHIFEVFAGHQIGCELKAISRWLDQQRAVVSLVASDLRREGLRQTGRREGQMAKFVEHKEVHTGEIVGEPALAPGADLVFEPVDEVDDDVETAEGPAANARSRGGHGEMRPAGAGSPDSSGTVVHTRLSAVVDR